MQAIEARRLKLTPALLADVRRRYERTSEGLAGMAADLGCSHETVRNLARREGWVRYVAPPRDLSPAARLAARAAALIQSPFVPAQAGTQNQTRDADGLGPGSPLARGRTEKVMPAEAALMPPHLADTAETLHDELRMLLADVRTERERMKREGYGKHDLREMSGTIASLGAVLRTLAPLLSATPQNSADAQIGFTYDDMPADLDAFRDELARRIRAFFAAREGGGDAGADAARVVGEGGA